MEYAELCENGKGSNRHGGEERDAKRYQQLVKEPAALEEHGPRDAGGNQAWIPASLHPAMQDGGEGRERLTVESPTVREGVTGKEGTGVFSAMREVVAMDHMGPRGTGTIEEQRPTFGGRWNQQGGETQQTRVPGSPAEQTAATRHGNVAEVRRKDVRGRANGAATTSRTRRTTCRVNDQACGKEVNTEFFVIPVASR